MMAGTAMTSVDSKRPRCLRVDEWPVGDRQAWLKALQPKDPFTKGSGSCAALARSTRGLVASGYGRYLWWLQESGRLDPFAAPGSRTEETNLLAYLVHLRASCSEYSVTTRFQQLGTVLKAIAPESNHAVILRASYRLGSDAKPSRNKRERVQSGDRTMALGYELLEGVENDRFSTPIIRARRYRDALLILFLTFRANRCANLASIEIDKHLVYRGDELWLCFESSDMKARREFDLPLPERLIQPIIRYIREFRPILLACTRKGLPPTNALWISSQGTQMTACAIALRVKALTFIAFGASMTPHFFRDGIATTQAIEAPESISDTAALLSHTSTKTAQKHYNQSDGIVARGRYGKAVDRWHDEGLD